MSKPKAERSETLPPREAIIPLHFPGEPARLCGNCEHFLTKDATERNARGRCRNLNSGRAQTTAKDLGCARGFYPHVERFPLHERLGIMEAR